MAELLDKARDIYEGEIDFEGQRLVEQLTNILLTAVGVVAFLVGYITSNIIYTLYVGLAGTALTFLIVVPSWPIYNKHPVSWLPARKGRGNYNISVDGKKVQ